MFNFGASANPPTQPPQQQPSSTGFSFGALQPQNVTQPSSNLSFSFGSAQLTGASQSGQLGSSLGLGTPFTQITTTTTSATSTTTITAARDLGGEGAAGGNSSSASKDPKDQPLPPELLAIVESFKSALKDQKTIRDENNQPRFSMQPIIDINNELDDNLRGKLEKLDVVLRKNKKTIEVLKKETSTLVSDAEAASRSVKAQGLETNVGPYPFAPSRYVPSSTHVYFMKLVDQYEEQMKMYAQQIKELARHLDNINRAVSPVELLTVVQRQHEALITLASEIYAIHGHIGRFGPPIPDPPAAETITIRYEGEKQPESETRQSTKPISFPTFVRHEKVAASPAVASKNEAQNLNSFPEAQSLSSPLSMSAQALSPGNMSLGSPTGSGISHSPNQSVGANQSIIF